MKTAEILTSINAFMGQMRDGNTRKLIANLQTLSFFLALDIRCLIIRDILHYFAIFNVI